MLTPHRLLPRCRLDLSPNTVSGAPRAVPCITGCGNPHRRNANGSESHAEPRMDPRNEELPWVREMADGHVGTGDPWEPGPRARHPSPNGATPYQPEAPPQPLFANGSSQPAQIGPGFEPRAGAKSGCFPSTPNRYGCESPSERPSAEPLCFVDCRSMARFRVALR